MLSQPTALGVGGALIVFAGINWLVAPNRLSEARRCEPEKVADGEMFGSVIEASAPTISEKNGATASSFAVIRELVNRQCRLGPAERGSEDEIRCALSLLLTDDNAGAIVKGLSRDELGTEFGVMALSRWATRDVVGASLWLAQQPMQSDEQTRAVAHALARDVVVLQVLGDLLPASPWREALLENAARSSMPDNPGGAVFIADRMQSGSARTRLLASIADEWALREPEPAARWIATESDLSVRDELLFSGAAARASIDLVSAFQWARGITSDATFEHAIDRIASMEADSTSDQVQRVATAVALRRDDRPGRMQTAVAD